MDIGVLMDTAKGLNELLNDTENIDDMLVIWNEVNTGIKALNEAEERIKTKIKTFLKERKWDRYTDDKSRMSVVLSVQKKQVIDKEQLKFMLTDSQYAQVVNTTVFERMNIVTPQIRKEMEKYVKTKKRQ